MHLFWIFVLTITAVKGGPAVFNKTENNHEDSDVTQDSFMRCSSTEGLSGIFHCAAKRALSVIHQAEYMESIELMPGVALTSDTPTTSRDGKAISKETIPVEAKHDTQKLITLILNEAMRVLSGRTLRIKIPDPAIVDSVESVEESRGKKKKKSPLLLILGAKALLLKAIFIAAIGAIAIKALIVAKVALVLSLIGAGQSLMGLFSGGLGGLKGGIPGFSQGHSSSYGPPGWTSNSIGGGWSNSQYPYARSIDNVTGDLEETQTEAHEIAYSGYKQ